MIIIHDLFDILKCFARTSKPAALLIKMNDKLIFEKFHPFGITVLSKLMDDDR